MRINSKGDEFGSQKIGEKIPKSLDHSVSKTISIKITKTMPAVGPPNNQSTEYKSSGICP